jgi:hypothetical protein
MFLSCARKSAALRVWVCALTVVAIVPSTSTAAVKVTVSFLMKPSFAECKKSARRQLYTLVAAFQTDPRFISGHCTEQIQPLRLNPYVKLGEDQGWRLREMKAPVALSSTPAPLAPSAPSTDSVRSFPLKGGGIGGLRPPFLVLRTPMRSIGYGGGRLREPLIQVKETARRRAERSLRTSDDDNRPTWSLPCPRPEPPSSISVTPAYS